MAIPENQGGDTPIDPTSAARGKSGARGTAGLSVDTAAIDGLSRSFKGLKGEISGVVDKVKELSRASGGIKNLATMFGGTKGGTSGSRINVPMAGTGGTGAPPLGGGGGGGKGGGGLGSSLTNFVQTNLQPAFDLANATSARIGRGAEYGLQADRMTVQLQQMYGMSGGQVRSQLRMPLTSHYLLGGGAAINQLLGMQASTGLNAAKQASTVESLRAVSGFSYGAGDITKMLTTMASPEVANRMFMMGNVGMYGIGGTQRSGMSSIQEIIRKTGLTNPEALRGALQQGSNTRQRLAAMGVPQDMQDMVIQYAMQNTQYQRKTNTTAMYDPSQEKDRRTMGIEESYIVQHEKTTGERIKREEKFYSRQTDNFARFEKNLRLTTQALGAFEDKLSGILGLAISAKGHPATQIAQYSMKQAYTRAMATIELGGNLLETGASAMGGDPIDDLSATSTSPAPASSSSSASTKKLSANNERKLAQLDPKLAVPLRAMIEARPSIEIGDAVRSDAQQEKSFKERYRRRPDLTEKSKESDRIWNGEVWEHISGVPMAPPGQSNHKRGLAADISWADKEWVRSNAARYGLQTGATTPGAKSDEPFHVEPAGLTPMSSGTTSATAGRVSATGASGSVSKASAKAATPLKYAVTPANPSGGAQSKNAGQMASAIEKAGISSQVSTLIPGIDKPTGGDPVDRQGTGVGGTNITIAPNIYLQGGGELTTDLRRIAKEVGALLDKEVRLTLMRSS